MQTENFKPVKLREVTLEQLSNMTNIRMLGWYDQEYSTAYELNQKLLETANDAATREDCKLLSALVYGADMPPLVKIGFICRMYADKLRKYICANPDYVEPFVNMLNDIAQPIERYILEESSINDLYSELKAYHRIGQQIVDKYGENVFRPGYHRIGQQIVDKYGENVFRPGEINQKHVTDTLDAYAMTQCICQFALYLRAASWQLFWAQAAYDRDGTRTNLEECFSYLRALGNCYEG